MRDAGCGMRDARVGCGLREFLAFTADPLPLTNCGIREFLAFDRSPFTPYQLRDALEESDIRESGIG